MQTETVETTQSMLDQKLIAYLDTLEGAVEKAADFTAEQTPLVVQEYLQFAFIENCISAGSAFLVLSILFMIPIAVFFLVKKIEEDPEAKWCGGTIAMLVCLVIGCVPLDRCIEATKAAAKVKYAPRVVILEKVSELTR